MRSTVLVAYGKENSNCLKNLKIKGKFIKINNKNYVKEYKKKEDDPFFNKDFLNR